MRIAVRKVLINLAVAIDNKSSGEPDFVKHSAKKESVSPVLQRFLKTQSFLIKKNLQNLLDTS
jgi:hypothetical protein